MPPRFKSSRADCETSAWPEKDRCGGCALGIDELLDMAVDAEPARHRALIKRSAKPSGSLAGGANAS